MDIISIKFQVPSIIAFGNVGFGKTQATKAALSLLGVQEANFVKNITDAKSFQRTSTTTLGIVIDDPTHPDEMAEKSISHFERGTHETVAAQYTPRTTFITSINMECLQMLSKRQRYITLYRRPYIL